MLVPSLPSPPESDVGDLRVILQICHNTFKVETLVESKSHVVAVGKTTASEVKAEESHASRNNSREDAKRLNPRPTVAVTVDHAGKFL